jgi:hypothetical protein
MTDRSFKTKAAEKATCGAWQMIRTNLVGKNRKKAAKLSVMTSSHHSRSYFYFMEPYFDLPCSPLPPSTVSMEVWKKII